MKRIVCKDYDEMSRVAASIYAEQVWKKPDSVLGFATGGTPVGMYKNLIDLYETGQLDFSRVTTVNLDEYFPIKKSNNQSYDYFMWNTLFSHINVKRENVHLPNGEIPDIKEACAAFDAELRAIGDVDIQLLGIGHNGHLAFNEPGDILSSETCMITLTEETVAANSRYFDTPLDVPRTAITMGVGAIMRAKRILLIASGKGKAPAVKEMFSGVITTHNPSTMLQMHRDAVIVLDEDAASLL